ncbi:MAG TPA: VTT domain-containing protein [Tepidisphaeraceae bacterium]|nr:VTT domain-containing protein [Tepidisphaeraceae bacterium]
MSAAQATTSTPAQRVPWRTSLGRSGPVALLAIALPVCGSLTAVAIGPLIAPWLRGQGWWGVVLFTVTFAVLGALAMAPTYSTSIIAGWTFGFRVGFPAVIIGTVTGAMFGYLLARRVAKERVSSTFAEHPKWEVVRRALAEERPLKTLWIVFLLRLSPVLPFGTTNVLMATTGVPLAIYFLGTLLGLAPRLGLVALAATGAENLDFDSAESWWALAAGLVATGICIVVLAVIGRHALDRATGQSSDEVMPVDRSRSCA